MITIISSTNRNNSYSERVANHVNDLLAAKGVDKKMLSLKDLPADFLFSHFNGHSNPDFVKIIEEYIIPSNKFIFVIPEYNGAFPGILKSFLDCVPPRHFHGKQASLIGVADGHAGALRALDMFTLVLNHIRVNVHWNKPKLSDIVNHFHGEKLNKPYDDRLQTMLTEFA